MAALTLAGCSAKSSAEAETAQNADNEQVTVPAFNVDSAYAYVQQQVDFGPRVPESPANVACRNWLVSKLQGFGADTAYVQEGVMPNGRGGNVRLGNVFAQFHRDATRRILLLAHYDTRPWADNDPDAANHRMPIDGANDGASGVGVILELARSFAASLPAETGVDVLFTDAEDSGISSDNITDADAVASDLTWCLGAQYFAAHLPYRAGAMPRAAVLLDMVGAGDARFGQEYFSRQAAPALVDRVWQTAAQAGHADRFVNGMGGAVNDDHLPLIQAGIPTIDIIEAANPQTGSFHPSWHTLADGMDNIDRATLQAVGATLNTFIYNYK